MRTPRGRSGAAAAQNAEGTQAAQGNHRAPDAAGQKVVRLGQLRPVQALLRSKQSTSQAGFTSERIPARLFSRRPILFDDGPTHDQHRKELARFFSANNLRRRHGAFIEQTAQQFVAKAAVAPTCVLDELCLHFSVRVASEIVGLTAGNTEDLAGRLEAFLRQPPVDHTLPDHGRSSKEWIRAARGALLPLMSFYLQDVRPAIRRLRAHPQEDIITHLLEKGYRPREVLMECLTYGTAGMVTTREFMSLVMLRMFDDAASRRRYLGSASAERFRLLEEIIRLNPPVSHLYRRVQKSGGGCPHQPGTMVDIDVAATNTDATVFTPDPLEFCPERSLSASERTGLSFGDGDHRCPGSHLAILETDALVHALLRAGAVMESPPAHHFNTLVQGYQLRDFVISFRAHLVAEQSGQDAPSGAEEPG